MLYQHDRLDYTPPTYWPHNGAPPYTENIGEVDWLRGPQFTLPAPKTAPNGAQDTLIPALPPARVPYTRAFDGALMVEIEGGFVSEQWARRWGYLAADTVSRPVVEARTAARAARKRLAKTQKELAAQKKTI